MHADKLAAEAVHFVLLFVSESDQAGNVNRFVF